MIGGRDIHLVVASGAVAMDFAIRTIVRRWPNAVFVADNDHRVLARYDELPLHETTEIIVYKDDAACRAWRKLGYDPSLRGTMFYLISDPHDLTIVIEDNPSTEAQLILDAILSGRPALSRLGAMEKAA